MYKIYINDNCLIIADQIGALSVDNERVKSLPFLAEDKRLLNYIDKLEKAASGNDLMLVTSNAKHLFKVFKSFYKKIKAAGGIIVNEDDKILLIERLGVWDLPKGKRDAGESNKDTAIREVEEETGLKCAIASEIGSTWHTYRDQKNRRILKKTAWYRMIPEKDQTVIVQESENISDYQWSLPREFLVSEQKSYASIRDILGAFVKQKDKI